MDFDKNDLLNMQIALRTTMAVLSSECVFAMKNNDLDTYNEKHMLKMEMGQLLHKISGKE